MEPGIKTTFTRREAISLTKGILITFLTDAFLSGCAVRVETENLVPNPEKYNGKVVVVKGSISYSRKEKITETKASSKEERDKITGKTKSSIEVNTITKELYVFKLQQGNNTDEKYIEVWVDEDLASKAEIEVDTGSTNNLVEITGEIKFNRMNGKYYLDTIRLK